MSTGALYPGTFDPITRGHADLIARCSRVFDRVVVAVAANPSKAPLLDLDERVALAREVLADLSNTTVTGYDALTVEFAREQGLNVIVRGLRTASDFEYEWQLSTMNQRLDPGIETMLMTPAAEFSAISATLVREIAAHGGDVSAFVHPPVAKRLQQEFSGKPK
ncbi:MAG: pantetheine-phosphate adenylyltransferase [Gammaproteobacteria bacterium]